MNKKERTKYGFLPENITGAQVKDTGMTIVIVCLLIGFFGKHYVFYKVAIPLLLINIIWPTLFKPVAKVWIGFSCLLGTVISKILLTFIFLFISYTNWFCKKKIIF